MASRQLSRRLPTSTLDLVGTHLQAAANILRDDGPRGFMKGWVANFARLGPQTVITFLVNEHLRKVLGMKSF